MMPESVEHRGSASITPKAAELTLSTNKPDLEIKSSAEAWQFFAFVFAALASLGFELIDEIPLEYWLSWRPRWAAKSLLFALLGYLLLFNWRVKTRVIRMLRW